MGVPDQYVYAPGALDRLARNGVPWQAVEWVLKVARPVVREFIGVAVLRVTGADPDGHLVMVTCLETDVSDTYEIVSARYLDPDEAAMFPQREDNDHE
jgi:hypothetical protein